MKKRTIIIIITVLILAILLVPVPCKLKDGGSTEYIALLYCVTDVHRATSFDGKDVKYTDGLIIEILGKEIYNNVD